MARNDQPEHRPATTTETGADTGTGAPATPEVVVNPAAQTATVVPASGQAPLLPESAPGQVPAPTQTPRLSASTVPVASVLPLNQSGGPETAIITGADTTANPERVSISRAEFDEHLLVLRRIAANIREARPGPYELARVADSLDAGLNALAGGVVAGAGDTNV